MPLQRRDVWNLDEQPLACGVLEAGLDDAELHCTGRMDENLGETSCAPSANLAVDALSEVEETGPDGVTPAEVADAVTGVVERERRLEVGEGAVADEASGRMRVETEHEEKREMMRVPEGLEALLADFLVSGRIHEDHDRQHEMTGETARLCVVDVERSFWADFCAGWGADQH